MSRLSEELASAYRAATYYVFDGDRAIALRTQHCVSALAELLSAHGVTSAAFVTACNPHGETTTDANSARQAALEREVSEKWLFLHGVGVARRERRTPEPSLLVLGIEREAARALGARHGQHAILFADAEGRCELLACDERNQPLLASPLERMLVSLGCVFVKNEPDASGSQSRRLTATFVPRRVSREDDR